MIRITDTLHEDQCTFTIISRSFLPRMRNISDKICGEDQNSYFISNNFLFENHAVYEIMWKNIVELGRTQVTIWHIRLACWISKATNTASEYVLIIASTQQKWLNERALILRYTHIACLVKIIRLIAT